METMRRVERALPPPLPRPVHQQRQRHAEEDFEATIGNLVRYYATLPPGVLEATVREQPAEYVEGSATQEVRATPRRRAWAWVLGGAASMVFGGVVTFALIVGRPDFWRVADRPVAAPARIAVAEVAPPKTVRGIPKAVPLADQAEEALNEAPAPAAKPIVESLAEQAAAVAPVAATPKPAAVTAAPAKRVKARRVRAPGAAPLAPPAAQPPSLPPPRTGDDWEDPYR